MSLVAAFAPSQIPAWWWLVALVGAVVVYLAAYAISAAMALWRMRGGS